MTRVAIPTFQNRVSPVLDTCQHLLILDIQQHREVSREAVFLGEMPLAERFDVIANLGVVTVICGGVSETFANMLKGSNVLLRNGVAGDVDEIITAFLEDRIDMPRYYMPGFDPRVS